MIKVTMSGSLRKTEQFLDRMTTPRSLYSDIESLAQRGVIALQHATPKETGLTAASWDYEIEIKGDYTTITWLNHHSETGANVAILLQYGHATGTGGYVSGRDYINPAIKPIFDEIANSVWKKVTLA